jgi:hypothetical protein
MLLPAPFLYEQESATERWRPILGVEQVIISVISMLSDPNDDSPANIDAAVSTPSWIVSYVDLLGDVCCCAVSRKNGEKIELHSRSESGILCGVRRKPYSLCSAVEVVK